jgi:xylitol oxidase
MDNARCLFLNIFMNMHNWAGNFTYSADHLILPSSVAELQGYIKKHGAAKVLGTRHCFNDIADSAKHSAGRLISLEQMDTVATADPLIANEPLMANNTLTAASPVSLTVTVGAGIRYGQLADFLEARGLALHNLASLPHISVAGACATATHGSGSANGNLAIAVSAMDILTAAGEIVSLSRKQDGDLFNGAVVHLGGLGIVTRLTLDVEPTYLVRQDAYTGLPFGVLEQHFEEIMGAGYSVSLFTDWQGGAFKAAWIKRRVPGPPLSAIPLPAVPSPAIPSPAAGFALTAGPDFFGARPALHNLHPIPGLSAEHCTEQMGIPGPWHERLPHFKMGFTPSSGEELQSEYFVPREHAYPAIKAIEKLRDRITPYLLISEIRTIDADPFWMSPCYRQPSAAIHFTWKRDPPAVEKLLPQIEEALAPFHPRPHWGKLFAMPPERMQASYPMFAAFRDLMVSYDPRGHFRNAFLERIFFFYP